MRLFKNTDPHDGSSCELLYEEANRWMRAIWVGYIDPQEAQNGAVGFLVATETFECSYLLNDNSALRGPWFDSVEWLRTMWAPQAARMGLRYIAHVGQPHDLLHEATALQTRAFHNHIQIQVFDDVPAAEEWLREQQKLSAPA